MDRHSSGCIVRPLARPGQQSVQTRWCDWLHLCRVVNKHLSLADRSVPFVLRCLALDRRPPMARSWSRVWNCKVRAKILPVGRGQQASHQSWTAPVSVRRAFITRMAGRESSLTFTIWNGSKQTGAVNICFGLVLLINFVQVSCYLLYSM